MKKDIHQLFLAYLENNCTKAEIEQLLTHFEVGNDRELLRQRIRQELAADREVNEAVNRVVKRVDERLFESIRVVNVAEPFQKTRKRTRYFKMAAIAASFLLVGFIWLQWEKRNEALEENTQDVYANDVQPGKQTAQLVLSTGKTVTLGERNESFREPDGTLISGENGALIYNNYSSETSSEQLWNTLFVPRAGFYHLVLPDGTQVWLNSASSITFPTKFRSNSRKVSISGEAYFEVARNEKAPFEIDVKGRTVKVLGTHFNVRAYDDVRATLFEGSVEVYNETRSMVLEPGQEALINKDNIDIYQANIAKAGAWRNGRFYFADESIESILEEVSRWYDVEIDLSHVKNKKNFSGTIKKDLKLSEVLKILSILTGYNFELQNKKVSII